MVTTEKPCFVNEFREGELGFRHAMGAEAGDEIDDGGFFLGWSQKVNFSFFAGGGK